LNDRPLRDYTRLAAALLVAGLVIGAAVFGASYFGTATTVTRTSTTITTTTLAGTATVTANLTQPCGDPVWSTNSSSTNANVPVLLMQPGSTALVCVTYQSAWAGNSSQFQGQFFPNDTYHFGLQIGKEDCVASAAETSCTEIVSHSFTVSAIPREIHPTPATDHVTVVYVISSLSNSTGFYDNSAPFDYCEAMPMAVGYVASQVNASDFAPRMVIPCAFLPYTPSSVSVSGINATYIAF